MTSDGFSPERWAYEITHLLNAVFGADRYPIDIATIARDYARQKFPDDPIIDVKGDNLPKFDGALYPVKRKGWAIIYNDALKSKGRINFTLAHEFGHYLLHRQKYPNGFECGPNTIARWDTEYGQVEHQANVFAANFLMPLDDFRRQIPADTKVDLDLLKGCAERYRVSLLAATLRWLSYTERRAVLVVSRDGYILWARSSEPALRSGAYFKTSNGPIEIPALSLAANPSEFLGGQGEQKHDSGIWFGEPVKELALYAEQYDFTVSLLMMENEAPRRSFGAEDDEPDTFDRFAPKPTRREW